MQQLMNLFQNGAQQYLNGELFSGWVFCVIFTMLSAFSMTYYHFKGRDLVNGKKVILTERFKGYLSLILTVVSPLGLIYNIHSLYLVYNNPMLKLFNEVF